MPRAKREPGAEPRPKAPPKTDPLEGLDYTVEKVEGGKWKAECLGTVSYGTTKKQALFMLSEELNGFKDTPPIAVTMMAGITQPLPPATVPVSTPAATTTTTPSANGAKGESYTIEDAEILWGIEFPSRPELFRELFVRRIQLKTEADKIKEEIDAINKSLLAFFDRQGVGSVKMEDWTVARVEGSSSTLDKEALVLRGVPVATILECTKRKEYTTVRVTGPKGGE